jgi:hypothetical protein
LINTRRRSFLQGVFFGVAYLEMILYEMFVLG